VIVLSPHTADSLSPLAEDQSWVMFVQVHAGGLSPIKIEGVRGAQIAERLRAIDADSAFEVYLIGLIPVDDPAAAMQAIMAAHATSRLRHDWFLPTIDLLAYVQSDAQTSLQELLAQARPDHVPDHAVDIDEIAEFLGVSTSTVRRMVKAGEIPHLRMGKALRFVPAEVLAALQRR